MRGSTFGEDGLPVPAGQNGAGEVRTPFSGSAPAAIGPYSHAVTGAGLLFVSGQPGLAPDNGERCAGSIEDEAAQAPANALAVLGDTGLGPTDVLKTTNFLTDLSFYAALNEVYATAFDGWRPARSAVEVRGLPRGARVEVELIAIAGGGREGNE